MRKIFLYRPMNVMGVLANIDVMLDEKLAARLFASEEESISIDEQTHVLQFVPSNGIGPKSDTLLIPRGNKSVRVTVSIKPGLLKNKLVTEMIEVDESSEEATGSDSEQSQKSNGLIGAVTKAIKDSQDKEIHALQAREKQKEELEEKLGESELLKMCLLLIKFSSGLYESDKFQCNDKLKWAFVHQGKDDSRSRTVYIKSDQIIIEWREKRSNEYVTLESACFTFEDMGYAPLEEIEYKRDSISVQEAFANVFVRKFKEIFSDEIEYCQDTPSYEYYWGHYFHYTVKERKLKSVI